jgi:hypothetical protein
MHYPCRQVPRKIINGKPDAVGPSLITLGMLVFFGTAFAIYSLWHFKAREEVGSPFLLCPIWMVCAFAPSPSPHPMIGCCLRPKATPMHSASACRAIGPRLWHTPA